MIKIKHNRNKAGKTQWWFVVTARNGRVLVTSETYKRRSGCEKGALSLKAMMRDEPVKIIETD